MTGFSYQMDASNGIEAFLNLRGALRSDNNKIWNDNLPRIEEIEIWGLLKFFTHVWKENENTCRSSAAEQKQKQRWADLELELKKALDSIHHTL